MLYWSEEEWHVASKYSPDGSNLIEIETQNKVFEKITVKNAFWKIWKELRYLYPENHICLTFKIRLRKFLSCKIKPQDEKGLINSDALVPSTMELFTN